MEALFRQLAAATTVRAVTDVLQAFQDVFRVAWVPVGGRENNFATINLGSDPASAMVERITNALDAVLEEEWLRRGQPTGIRSPRAAVHEWFGISERGLEELDARDPVLTGLAQRVRVTLYDSERRDRPTVDFRDRGVGLRAEEFAETILSLNETRKLRKLFLAGAYGQGGSTALSYSQYTIIISRRCRTNELLPYPVAFTVVRFDPGDLEEDKHGIYQYMINHTNGQPFFLEFPEKEFPAGTLVRHVSMDIGKYHGIMTVPTNSPYYVTHHYLFDPVLPFTLEDRRERYSKGFTRIATGNHRLLTRGDNTEYQNQAVRKFRNGTVNLTWWVLSAEGTDKPRERIAQYCPPSRPIIITYHGRKQGDLPNTVIRNDLRLPYLEGHLVVHVACDGLDSESRRQLFPTTRESLRETAILPDLRQLVTETLAGDPKLAQIDHERKQRFMRRVDSQSIANLRRRLASRIKAVLLTADRGGSTRVAGLGHQGRQLDHERIPIPAQEPPTFLEITTPSPHLVYAGASFMIRFRTDASPIYFLDPDAFIAVIDPSSFGQYTGSTSVRDGYGTTYFRAAAELSVDTTAEIALELRPKRTRALTSSVAVKVAQRPDGAGDGVGKAATPNINPQWVATGDPFWKDREWDSSSVAEVVQTGESVDVYVSSDNEKLSQLIARAQRRDAGTVDSVKDFYLEHVAFHAVLLDLAEQEADRSAGGGGTRPPSDADKVRQRELQRACETICGIAEAILDWLAAEASVASSAESDK